MTDSQRFETAAIHAGQDPDPATGAAVGPIYQTSTYVQEGVARHRGYDYSRTANPTRTALETCLAALEEARHCVAFGSGMAAIATLAMTVRSGDRVVIPDDVYGGTYRLFDKVMGSLGLRCDTVDMTDLAAVRQTLADDAALMLAESPTNPRLRILDLAALAELAHAAGARFVVDNTFATPYLQRPLRLGADAVVYSATKYLGGHSDLVVGAVTLDDDELAARVRFLQGSVGAVPGPFDSWLLLRGLKTLGVRMRAALRERRAGRGLPARASGRGARPLPGARGLPRPPARRRPDERGGRAAVRGHGVASRPSPRSWRFASARAPASSSSPSRWAASSR